MAKLYFKYGAMGSSKSAQALIAKFNYEERGMSVWLIKPSVDKRDVQVKSRIGLCADVEVIEPSDDIYKLYKDHGGFTVVIADECQFFTPEQIDQLRLIVDQENIAVLCFGLRTDFRTKTFPGSHRLLEVADVIEEIKTMCECGSKAIVNARIDSNGRIITDGDQILLGGNDQYIAMCHRCWTRKIREQNNG